MKTIILLLSISIIWQIVTLFMKPKTKYKISNNNEKRPYRTSLIKPYHLNTSSIVLTFVISSLFFTMADAQSFGYKALIKDANGQVLANQNITAIFEINEQPSGNAVFVDIHTTVSTDANGILIVNIGEGDIQPGGNTLLEIDWSASAYELEVSVDAGNGTVNLGSAPILAVPFAFQAAKASNVTGLETIDEGNGIGWRLIGADPQFHNAIGENAIDLTLNEGSPGGGGAPGTGSFAVGYASKASGTGAIALGDGAQASGNRSLSIGINTRSSGNESSALGFLTTANGDKSTAFGFQTTADAFASLAVGRYNVGNGNSTTWLETDPLFEVGNGSGFDTKNNALTIRKDGQHTINSSSSGLIINSESQNFDNGLQINMSTGNGIEINNEGGNGIQIGEVFTGINIQNAQSLGVRIFEPQGPGIQVINPEGTGVIVNSSELLGGFFGGNNAGVIAESTNDLNPDIILGGSFGTNSEADDGVLSSDPDYAGSDIFLRSYDAVVVQLDFDNNETGQFEIKAGNGTEVFEVRESGNATLAGILTQNSDRRLKKDIAKLPYGLNEILQLQPKTYNWKNREQKHKSLGLIAQEVKPIIKEIVNTQDDEAKTLGISYIELIPVLINAIKEQQAIINNQKELINDEKLVNKSQEKIVLSLLKRVEALEANQSH